MKKQLGILWTRVVRSTEILGAKLAVKRGRPAVRALLNALALLGRRLTPSTVSAVVTFASKCYVLRRNGGTRFLVIYLKACTSMLQQALGGQRLSSLNPFGSRPSRTGSGLPRIIPAPHRDRIRKGEVFAIRLWMTLFGVYRILSFQGKVKLNTITDPSTMDQSYLPVFSNLVTTHFVPALWRNFGKAEDTILEAVDPDGDGPLDWVRAKLRARPFVISKSGPSIRPENSRSGAQSTSPASILDSAFAWSGSPLFPMLEAWCKMTGSIWILNRIEMWGKVRWIWEGGKPLSRGGSDTPFLGTNLLGKLGFKDEPGGKVRVFAMVDPWTQWMMEPLHKAVFNLLRCIPQDGTFDQLKPIERLLRKQRLTRSKSGELAPLFSYDLSSATDRIPLSVQKALLSPFLTSWGAEVWGSLLVGRDYSCPAYPKAGIAHSMNVQYACGQPMGALSSWALLALVHHFLVQSAALAAGVTRPGIWFRDYAVLGDDIVIMGSAVAKEYRSIMNLLGVEIGDHKSLVSLTGSALEFAKRTFYKGSDVSMIPFPEHIVGTSVLAGAIALCGKYNLTLGSFLTALGFGYKAKASANQRLVSIPRRLRNYILAYYGPSGPGHRSLRVWLGMHSISKTYATTLTRVSTLLTGLVDQELKLLKDRVLALEPLVKAAKLLSTTYRDREHYGTISRAEGNRITDTYPGMTLEGQSTAEYKTFAEEAARIVDSLNETVYRTTFADVPCDYRDLLAKLEEFETDTPNWESVYELWDLFEAIQRDLGALPLPRELTLRIPGRAPSDTIGDSLKRWYRHSGIFRKAPKAGPVSPVKVTGDQVGQQELL